MGAGGPDQRGPALNRVPYPGIKSQNVLTGYRQVFDGDSAAGTGPFLTVDTAQEAATLLTRTAREVLGVTNPEDLTITDG